MKQSVLFGPKTIKFEDVRLGFNSVRYHCCLNSASYAAIFWLLELMFKMELAASICGQQERDVVFDDVKRTDGVQGGSLGRG